MLEWLDSWVTTLPEPRKSITLPEQFESIADWADMILSIAHDFDERTTYIAYLSADSQEGMIDELGTLAESSDEPEHVMGLELTDQAEGESDMTNQIKSYGFTSDEQGRRRADVRRLHHQLGHDKPTEVMEQILRGSGPDSTLIAAVK